MIFRFRKDTITVSTSATRELEVESRESGIGNRESGIGNRESGGLLLPLAYCLLPSPPGRG
ncbi:MULTISPECIES: hypothetical protein [Moorena]|uniref:hypothetical protein n=1 Tax=Moorena TaxID=1155738 RepID=UPI000302EB1E|nr:MULTISPECIES: hypothetical protein [Moorena]NEP30010.1 hypothetical protein [Moorena sp. SIO3B2]NEP65471.1 hypothetical protein [Moorena sp. SIO3A5]NEQ10266.1 hypothetical protein [Moorena sp. SIO4E2]NER85662.1 hypothetical protein [Moorena sp. SIO3A2]